MRIKQNLLQNRSIPKRVRPKFKALAAVTLAMLAVWSFSRISADAQI